MTTKQGQTKALTNKQVAERGEVVDSWPCDLSMTEGGGEERIVELEGKQYSLVYNVIGPDFLMHPNRKAVEL